MAELSESARSHDYDPRRYTRRHHYQEGPDFLFVATQGGRPSDASSQSPQLARVRTRMCAVRYARHGVGKASKDLGCPTRSLQRWLAAFEAQGIAGLVEGCRRPLHVRACVPTWVDQVIITIRLLTYWNSKRIAAEMDRRQIYRVGHDHIDRLLQKSGCARGSISPQPGPRYERTSPNELWHIDIKGPFFISLGPRGYIKTYLVGLVDDHSRFVIGLRILPPGEGRANPEVAGRMFRALRKTP